MDHYPSPLDPTRDLPLARRLSDMLLAAGASALVAVVLAADDVKPYAWWIIGVPTALALVVIICDEIRLWRLNSRAWTTEQWNLLRETEYRRRQGVFLTHTAVPALRNSDDGRKWWTVTFQLIQHGEGPLSSGAIKEVEYSLGPRFTDGRVSIQGPTDSFPYETDAHGSFLVLGRVVFRNRLKRPLIVERYVRLPRDLVAGATP